MKMPTLLGLQYRAGQAQLRAKYLVATVFDRARLGLTAPSRERIAAVVCGRNDDYMPDFEHRLRASVIWNLRHLLGEVVFVEWNPPSERELLSPGLATLSPRVRAYVVPPSIHQAIAGVEALPMLEYHAKNVGIRRAGEPWVVATNADALFGFSLARTLRRAILDHRTAWTAQRIDIPWREGRKSPARLWDVLWYRRVVPEHELGTGEFLLASQDLWLRAGGYDETSTGHRIGLDKRGAAQLKQLGARPRSAGTVFHLAHPTSCTEGVRPHHGLWAGLDDLPYTNPTGWGLSCAREVEIAERVWRLEP